MATMISDINIIDETSLSLSNSKLEENVEMKFEVTVGIAGFHFKSLVNYIYLNNRERYFRGRVSNLYQSKARMHCFLASDWLKFETLPRKYCTPYISYLIQKNIIIFSR